LITICFDNTSIVPIQYSYTYNTQYKISLCYDASKTRGSKMSSWLHESIFMALILTISHVHSLLRLKFVLLTKPTKFSGTLNKDLFSVWQNLNKLSICCVPENINNFHIVFIYFIIFRGYYLILPPVGNTRWTDRKCPRFSIYNYSHFSVMYNE